jgi:hypothetical protein
MKYKTNEDFKSSETFNNDLKEMKVNDYDRMKSEYDILKADIEKIKRGCADANKRVESELVLAYAKIEKLKAKLAIAIEALEMAIDLQDHYHSEDERGWESMCIDCENKRQLEKHLEKIKREPKSGI